MTEPIPETRCGSCSQHQRVGELSAELANIHAVHIEDIRALVRQFEAEQAGWADKLQQAVGRECGALCGDIEQDRAELAAEVERMRTEGVPGVVHRADQTHHLAMIADRDRFADLHRNLGERQRRLIGEYRGARYAVKLVGEVETLLSVALGRPGSVSRDNMLAAVAELVRERDHCREQVAMWASPDSNINRNEQIVATLQQKIGEAVGTEIGRDRMVEVFDHLVSQYRVRSETESEAAERTELLQDTVNIQQRTIDTQLEDIATQKRIAESQARLYAGLESASQAVGQQLTQQIRRNDQLRGRLRVADDLLHEANGVIRNAENLKLTLKCLSAHCIEGDHAFDMENPVPIGDQDWRDAQRRWAEQWHVFMASGRSDRPEVDRPAVDRLGPLAGFTVRAVSDGARELVRMQHLECDRLSYSEFLHGVALTRLTRDAHRHMARYHTETPDEASPDDERSPCEDICHPSQGACCGNPGEPPTEVNE